MLTMFLVLIAFFAGHYLGFDKGETQMWTYLREYVPKNIVQDVRDNWFKR